MVLPFMLAATETNNVIEELSNFAPCQDCSGNQDVLIRHVKLIKSRNKTEQWQVHLSTVIKFS